CDSHREQIAVDQLQLYGIVVPVGEFFGQDPMAFQPSLGSEEQQQVDQDQEDENIEKQLYRSQDLGCHIGDHKAQDHDRKDHEEPSFQVKGPHASFHRPYLGISILSTICPTTAVAVSPSISRSGLGMMRCPRTGTNTFLMSSGMTKSRPLIAARALDASRMAMDALGDAPRYRLALLRVWSTIEAIYLNRFCSTMISLTLA